MCPTLIFFVNSPWLLFVLNILFEHLALSHVLFPTLVISTFDRARIMRKPGNQVYTVIPKFCFTLVFVLLFCVTQKEYRMKS
jgi:hypothetical protein